MRSRALLLHGNDMGYNYMASPGQDIWGIGGHFQAFLLKREAECFIIIF